MDSHDTPLWTPSAQARDQSLMMAFARRMGFPDSVTYPELYAWSNAQSEQFWSSFWDFADVVGEKGGIILRDGADMEKARFFPEGTLNWAENLLQRDDDALAVIFRDETGRERTLTFSALREAVSRFQQALKQAGVKKGDRVAGYMPNMPETLVAALAAASFGAIWSSASPDFGVQGVIDRFGQITPDILVTVDGYFYNGKTIDVISKTRDALASLPSVRQVVVVPFVSATPDISSLACGVLWDDFIAPYPAAAPLFEKLPFAHPLFIMFSSGTTGVPKCIVHGHGGTLIQHKKELMLHCDVRPDDRVFYFTTCGWMMWNWTISALSCGACLMLYDGSPFYPTPYALWDYTTAHGCTLFGTGAKYIDALKSEGCVVKDRYDLTKLRTLTSTGSPLVHESFDYVYRTIKSDLHLASISGGTDIISCFVLGNPLSPVWRGEIQGGGLGMSVHIFNDEGQSLGEGAGCGDLVCTKPFPSMPVGFWNDESGEKYHAAYFDRFPNVWCHGDWVEKTIHHGLIVHGRSDATLNPGGVRIGTAEIYRQVEQVPEVVESLAVGQMRDGDERVILFVRLKAGVTLDDDLLARIKSRIRSGATPRHVPAKIIQVADIPRTKSNKIVELAVKNLIHGRPVKNVEALANPEALELYKNLPELAD